MRATRDALVVDTPNSMLGDSADDILNGHDHLLDIGLVPVTLQRLVSSDGLEFADHYPRIDARGRPSAGLSTPTPFALTGLASWSSPMRDLPVRWRGRHPTESRPTGAESLGRSSISRWSQSSQS